MIIAPVASFHDHTKSFAWGQDEVNKECVRCRCGKWMRITSTEVINGIYHIRHFEVHSGGDFMGFGCGADEAIILEGWSRYKHE